MESAKTNSVTSVKLDCDFMQSACQAFETTDGIDGKTLHVVKHTDDDISLYLEYEEPNACLRQIVMSPTQAKAFFQAALTLCNEV